MNSSGFPILASYSLAGRLDGFRRAVPLVEHLVQTIVKGSVHFNLRGDVGKGQHRALRRNDLGIAAAAAQGHGLNALKAADNAADPASGPPIDHRPALSVRGIAHSQDVLLREVDIQIAVGVRCVGDVTVPNSGI